MGNATSMENWAARERLRLIERAVWWRGWIGRPDLVAMFGISSAQASSDLQKYQELNPGALNYQMSRKRYEGAEGMRCVLHEPRLEEGMAVFLGDKVAVGATAEFVGTGRVEMVKVPRRPVSAEVERRIFLAVCAGLRLEVNYHSVSSGRSGQRMIVPRAFAHDGLRWHVRAWCGRNGAWQDFVLGRISRASWPESVKEEPPVDESWETFETLQYRINPSLSAERRAALAMDYGVGKSGILKLRCRRAMRQYVEAMLRVPVETKRLPGHFVPA
ncbi:WYL domain-containing protein [Haloferula sargassicola]|uniref:WYL domain-containing protein n=1 Tax=Haloferula sargassicola TaxID=490096 RepID=A0ABP9UPD0_9BACT